MASGFVILKNQYYDSVFLMRLAKNLNDEPGVEQSAALMATENNKSLLAEIGITGNEIQSAAPNDLIVALVANDQAQVDQLLSEVDERLHRTSEGKVQTRLTTLESAVEAQPNLNLAVISVPGPHAARQARKALENGLHVFLFSDNVTVEQEIEIKLLAQEKGLLVMGPDCGTSILGGKGIGFANVVRRGPVGVVGASGTGIQEFTSLVHQAGSGISHAIGTGSHDLSDQVGGITTLMGLKVLQADPNTKIIAIVSKPAGPKTLSAILQQIQANPKPVVACFLGLQQRLENVGENFHQAKSLDDAADLVLSLINHTIPAQLENKRLPELLAKESQAWLPQQRYLRGLFAGGTFCFQAQQILRDAGILTYSNAPLDKRYWLSDPETSLEHSLVDMGDDHFTQGKPHPMIDASQRARRIREEAKDPEAAILLLDIILGYVSSPDPAGDLYEAIRDARQTAADRGGHLTVVASVCGTSQDPQNLERQIAILKNAGAIVFQSNARAAAFCVDLMRSRR
jgi:FdrA protein